MKKILFFALSLLFITITLNNELLTYPKFAALTGEKCASCHVNPTGGNMRNKYGLFYARENLHLQPFEKLSKDTLFNPQLNKTIQIGGDFRMIYINQQTGQGSPDISTFFQMQGDLQVSARVHNYLTILLNAGIQIPNTFSSVSPGYVPVPLPIKHELFGLIHNLPLGMYFKIGRFIQNFGIKIPEHRAFNRQYNDFYTPYAADAGIEFGISPSILNFTVGFSNGNSRDIRGTLNNSYDFDNQKQLTSSLDARWVSKNGKFAIGLGGSYLNNPFKYDIINNINAVRQIGAGFLSIGLFERVAILAEYDYNRLNIRDSLDTKRDFNTVFAEINVRLLRGLELKSQFESFDPMLGLKDGGAESKRYSFGFVVYPFNGMELESIYRINQEPAGIDYDPEEEGEQGLKNNEWHTTFRFYF